MSTDTSETPKSEGADAPEPVESTAPRTDPPSVHAALLRAHPDLHDPRPLSTYLWGTQTVWFVGGGSAERRVCQDDANRFERIWGGKEPAEPVPWHTSRWMAFKSERVAMMEWICDCMYGSEYSPEEKRVLRDLGYDEGHLGALVDLWRGVREPSYSPLVVDWLLHIAATAQEARHETFVLLARTYEGEFGAQEARRVWEQTRRDETAVLWQPDDREPEGEESVDAEPGEATRDEEPPPEDEVSE